MEMSIEMTNGNDPIRQQRLAPITCYKCAQKGHYRKGYPKSTGTSPVPDLTPMYSPPTSITEVVTASYAIPTTG